MRILSPILRSFIILAVVSMIGWAGGGVWASEPIHLNRFVTDETATLSPDVVRKLEQLSVELEQKTGIQCATYVPKTLGDKSIDEFSSDVFSASGIGQKGKDNGVLIVIAPTERKVRIEVGYGLEGDLPDGMAGQIIREEMTPYFKAKNLAGGIVNGHVAVVRFLANAHHVTLSGVPKESIRRVKIPKAVQYLGLTLFIVFMVSGGWRVLPFFLLGGGFQGGRSGRDDTFGGFGGGSSGGGGASSSW